MMNRRAFLRGTGVAIALPWLEAMGVYSTSLSKAGELAPSERPRRAVFTQWGMGMNPLTATPDKTGLDYALPEALKPLAPFQGETTYFTGMHAVDGGHSSDHCFLTGANPKKTGKYGTSCDQLIAERFEGKTRFPSLVLSWTRQTGFGGAGDGTLSWTKGHTPVVPESDPQVVFNRLFRPDSAAEIAARKKHAAEQRSVLDSVGSEARKLQGKLGKADREKLQEYFDSIRDVEEQFTVDGRWLDKPKPKVDPIDFAKAKLGWFKSMFSVISLALQTDSTRVISFLARDSLNGSSFPIKERNVPWNFHTITHNGGDKDKLAWWTKMDAWQMEDWAFFLNKLKGMREGTGNVLDHTMAVWGTTNGGLAAHWNRELPALISGGTALGLKHVGHVACDNKVPLGNLMRTVTETMGVRVDDRFYGGAHTGAVKLS
jgi:hypothetical protein